MGRAGQNDCSGEIKRERRSLIAIGASANCANRCAHSAGAVQMGVGKGDKFSIGRRCGRGAAQLLRHSLLAAMGRQRAGGDKGCRRRSTDASIAVDHKRRAPIPIRKKIQ